MVIRYWKLFCVSRDAIIDYRRGDERYAGTDENSRANCRAAYRFRASLRDVTHIMQYVALVEITTHNIWLDLFRSHDIRW